MLPIEIDRTLNEPLAGAGPAGSAWATPKGSISLAGQHFPAEEDGVVFFDEEGPKSTGNWV